MGSGPDGRVLSVASLDDGGFYAAGEFHFIRSSSPAFGLARMWASGPLDERFPTDLGPNQSVRVLAVDASGRVLVAGEFTTIHGRPRGGLARLDEDGHLDATFSPVLVPQAAQALLPETDGRMLVCGAFTSVNGEARPYLVRLNPDGSLDGSYLASPDEPVLCLARQSDGKTMAGGMFQSMGIVYIAGLARLNEDGSLNGTFYPEAVFFDVATLSLQSDGHMVAGGSRPPYVSRYDASGALDTSFAANANLKRPVSIISQLPDGRFLVGGQPGLVTETGPECLVRLNADGTPDGDFHYAELMNQGVAALLIEPGGKILVGGPVDPWQTTGQFPLARLNPDGTRDESFQIASGFNSAVFALTQQSQSRALVGGTFGTYDGEPFIRLTRILLSDSAPSSLWFNAATARWSASTGFEVQVCGPAGSLCLTEASDDLSSWLAISTNLIPPAGCLLIRDGDGRNHPGRFYRASR